MEDIQASLQNEYFSGKEIKYIVMNKFTFTVLSSFVTAKILNGAELCNTLFGHPIAICELLHDGVIEIV